MAESEAENGETVKDRSDESLTPQEAWRLTEEQGMMGKTVAKMFDISPARVSQLKGQYKEGIQEGRESVTPSDFSEDELKEAIGDDPTESPYENECPACEEIIPAPETPGQHPCPECGETLEWGEDEI